MNISCWFLVACILIVTKDTSSLQMSYNNARMSQEKSVFERNKRQIKEFDDNEVSFAKDKENKKMFRGILFA